MCIYVSYLYFVEWTVLEIKIFPKNRSFAPKTCSSVSVVPRLQDCGPGDRDLIPRWDRDIFVVHTDSVAFPAFRGKVSSTGIRQGSVNRLRRTDMLIAFGSLPVVNSLLVGQIGEC